MSNLRDAFNYNGNFDAELWYVTLFDEIPCKYCIQIQDEGKQIDTKQLTIDKCKHLYNDFITYRYAFDEVEGSSEDDEETDIELPENLQLILEGEAASSLCIALDHKVIVITYNKIVAWYSNTIDVEEIKKLLVKTWECFPKQEPEEKTARVGLIKFSQGEYYTSFSSIRKTNINIEENYNDDFLRVHKDVIDFLNQRESGLVLLYGKMGSGKSSYIRHLCSTIPKDYVIVPNSVAARLGDPDFISYVTSCKDYVFILEDCEQLLVDREENPWNNAISTILNMADGLLSDIVNIKFICTFNAAVEKIDPALLRKGRCFAKYEFKDLSEDKVKILNDKYNLGIEEVKPMTLAEIYNSEKTDYSEETRPKKKIGF